MSSVRDAVEQALKEHEYLGDGCYARFDGYQIWLYADRDGMRHEVALEQDVFRKLLRYAKSLNSIGASFPLDSI